MTFEQSVLTCVSLAAVAVMAAMGVVVCVTEFHLPAIRQSLQDFRRLPWYAQLFLVAFVSHFVVYGSVKTNQTDRAGGDVTNAPLMMLMMSRPAAQPTVTEAEISRGWQLVEVRTNAVVDYTMPQAASLDANWWVRGAFDDARWLSLSASTLSGWRFPFGGGEYDSIWALVWGELRFVLGDASTEISAVGSPMSAVPYRSRLWIADGTDGSRLVTWEDFALNRDPDTPINAQIVLFRNGDFVTRSNDVETVFRRVDPEDWDDDGIPNVDDPHPYSSDGDFFGPRQSLPAGANADAYCWVELVSEVNSHVTFTGDGPSDLPDPDFMVRAGETNRVILLIGKTYSVASSRPVSVVAKSDPAIEVTGDGTCGLGICWPVGVSVAESEGGCFTMRVTPGRVGGTFSWNSECCPVSGSGRSFFFDCGWRCLCIGCTAYGTFVYEGYSLPVSGGECGCSPGPRPCRTAPDDQMVAGVSASFSPGAVIFEDAYTNMPGEVVGRRSTEAVLTCSVHGGFRGGTASFSFTGSDRLGWVRGAAVPQTTVTIPAGEKLEFAAAYEGMSPSESVDDVVFAVTFIENDVPEPLAAEARLTSVKVELTPEDLPPMNPSPHRHLVGINEKVNHAAAPASANVRWIVAKNQISDDDYFNCPWTGGVYVVSAKCCNAQLDTPITVVEPVVECREARWDEELDASAVVGESGWVGMKLSLYLLPRTVSFDWIEMEEVPVPSSEAIRPTGYFYLRPDVMHSTHDAEMGAGKWFRPRLSDGSWTHDKARMPYACPPFVIDDPPEWTQGTMRWAIPVGCGELVSDANGGVERALRRVLNPNPTDQVYEMEAGGTLTIRKYNHSIRRDVSGRVWLDGSRVNAWWNW